MAANTAIRDAAVLPCQITVTTGLTEVWQEIVIQPGVGLLTFYAVTNAGKLSWNGAGTTGLADAGTWTTESYVPLPANTFVELRVKRDPEQGVAAPTSFFVTATTGSTVIRIVAEPEE